MKRLVLLSAIFISYSSIAQTILSGRVIQKGTTEPVAYATIGLAKKNTGTNADEKGVFHLRINTVSGSDTIIVSSVGYETLRVPVESGSNELAIELERKFSKLTEVVIKKNWQSVILNESRSCGDISLVSSGFQTQVAQQLEAPVPNSYIRSVRLCTGSFIFSPAKYIFRLRVYGVDSITGGPGADLCNEVIEVRSDSRREKIDLTKYNIVVPGKIFFVAVEWIYIPYNRRGWTEEHNTHGPGIGMFKEEGKEEVWALYHNNKWMQMFNYGRTAISATVNY